MGDQPCADAAAAVGGRGQEHLDVELGHRRRAGRSRARRRAGSRRRRSRRPSRTTARPSEPAPDPLDGVGRAENGSLPHCAGLAARHEPCDRVVEQREQPVGVGGGPLLDRHRHTGLIQHRYDARDRDASSFEPELFEFLRELGGQQRPRLVRREQAALRGEVLEPALAFIEDFGYRAAGDQPALRADTRTTAARCSASTATRGSPRTRRRTRPTPACTSATSAPRTRTRPATTCTSSRGRSSPAAGSGTRTQDGDPDPSGDRRRPRALAGGDARAAVPRRARPRGRQRAPQARAVGLPPTTSSPTTCAPQSYSAGPS